MDEGEWDLGEVLRERPQPRAKLAIYLAEEASARKHYLLERMDKTKEPEEIEKIQAQIDEVEAEIQASKYILHLTAVPSRMREDIASKAMHAYPMKLDPLGRDDMANAIARKDYENLLIWVAQIEDVERNGKHRRNWNEETMKQFMDSMPTAVQKMVDGTIKALTTASERFTIESANPDF